MRHGASMPVVRNSRAFTLSAQQMTQLTATVGFQIVPGQHRHYYIPTHFDVQKRPGAAFSLSGGTAANIGVGHINLGYNISIASAGLLDQTIYKHLYRTQVGVASAGDTSESYMSFALGIILQGAGSMSGGSPVDFVVEWLDVDCSLR